MRKAAYQVCSIPRDPHVPSALIVHSVHGSRVDADVEMLRANRANDDRWYYLRTVNAPDDTVTDTITLTEEQMSAVREVLQSCMQMYRERKGLFYDDERAAVERWIDCGAPLADEKSE